MPADNPFASELARRRTTESPAGANPFAAELQRRQGGAEYSGGEAFGRGLFNTVVDNLLGFGNAAIKVARGQPLVDLSIHESADPRLNQKIGPDVRLPSREQIVAGAYTAAETPRALLTGDPRSFGERYDEAIDYRRGEESAMREQQGFAMGAGEVAGDIATILAGRAPVAGLVRKLESRLAARPPKLADGVAGDIGAVVTSEPMRALARGAGRSLESGLEAAALEIVKGDDPLEAAAFAAGGQVAGSAFLSAAKGMTSGGPYKAGIKLSVAAVSAMGLLQVLKSATPGGRDRVLESIETGYDRVAFALAMGAASAALGAGRYGRSAEGLAEQTKAVLDGIATTHRGATLSILTDWVGADDKGKAEIERAIEGLASDPEYEGSTELERRVVSRLSASRSEQGKPVRGVILR